MSNTNITKKKIKKNRFDKLKIRKPKAQFDQRRLNP